MADVCAEVTKHISRIREMLKEQKDTNVNQTASIEGGKIVEVKSSVGTYRNSPKNRAVIYTGSRYLPTDEADSRDVRELIEKNRPFICRAVTVFGKPNLTCYTTKEDNETFQFVKDDIERTSELRQSFRSTVESIWGAYIPSKLSDTERAFAKELRGRNYGLDDVLDTMAPEILTKCKVKI